jgi:hypothetical protein
MRHDQVGPPMLTTRQPVTPGTAERPVQSSGSAIQLRTIGYDEWK